MVINQNQKQTMTEDHSTFRKGRRLGIPRAEATTANARAVVLRTYSSILSISGRIVEIIVANPAA